MERDKEKTVLYYYEIFRKNTRIIMIGTLVCMFVTAAISLFIPNIFQSIAQLVIIPPKFKTELTPTALSVATCKNLLESPEMIRKIKDSVLVEKESLVKLYKGIKDKKNLNDEQILEQIDKMTSQEIEKTFNISQDVAKNISELSLSDKRDLLKLNERKFKKLKIEDLKQKLRVRIDIESKTNISVLFSPVITLYVKAPSPNLAKIMANIWSKNFVELYTKLSLGETTESFDFIKKQYETTKADLETSENNITSFVKKVKLEVIRDKIKVLQNKLIDFNSDLQKLIYEYTTKYSELQEIENQMVGFEENERWLGIYTLNKIESASISKDKDVHKVKMPNMDDESLRGAILKDLRVSTIGVGKNLFEVEKEIENYTNTHNVETLLDQKEKLIDLTAGTQGMLVEVESTINGLKESIKETQSMLQNEKPYIALNKTITNDALWMLINKNLTKQDIDSLKGAQFNEQQTNYVYEGLIAKLNDLKNELALNQEKKVSLKNQITDFENQLKDTDKKIAEYQSRTNLLQISQKAAQDLYEKTSEAYIKLRDQQSTLRINVAVLQTKINEVKRTIQKTQDDVASLIEFHREKIVEFEKLTREKDRNKNTYKLLETKYELARISKSETPPDIKIASNAVVPDKKIGPMRKIMVFTAGIIGLIATMIFSIFITLVSEYAKKDDKKTA